MKKIIVHSLVLAVISCFFGPYGQISAKTPSTAAPHLVRILLDSAAAQQFRSGFASLRTGQPDIQQISLTDSNAIESVLHLPSIFHNISLKPYLPEHSVVFQDIREHINPSLFQKEIDQPLSIKSGGQISDDLPLFKKSEERLSRWFVLRYSDTIAPEVAAKLCKKSREIEIAEPLYPAEPQTNSFVPNDSLIGLQWALDDTEINAFNAWGVVTCDSTMVVGVVDMGFDLTHKDLANAVWINPGESGSKSSNKVDDDNDGFVDDWRGWDFAGAHDELGFPDNDPSTGTSTTDEHGTFTSGLLAASGNDHHGIAGVAFGAKFIPVKTASDDFGKSFYCFPGIIFAADHGATVISCSIGEPYQSAADEDVVNYAYGKGSVVVVSASNSGAYEDWYPASYHHAFSVGGVDRNRYDSIGLTGGFTHNKNVAVAAPGVGILCTSPNNGYGTLGGTSLACPMAAGGIALILESALRGPLHAKYPNITNGQAMAQLRATTTPINADQFPGFNGKGIIDLYNAVTDLNAHELRIESFDVLNGTSDGLLMAGQTAKIRLHLKNYLSPLANVKASVVLIDSNGNAYDPSTGIIHTSDTSLTLGAFATLEESATDPGLLHIAVDNNAPAGSSMLIKFIFTDSEADYTYNDYDYIKLIVAPAYRTLDTNHIAVSIFDNGEIGHQTDEVGDGFIWQTSPQEIYGGNQDLLYRGGLMVAADADRLAESMGYVTPNQSGFSSGVVSLQAITSPSPGQKVTTSFTATLDNSTDNSSLDIDENAFEFNAAPDAVILDYNLHNGQNLSAFATGLYMDWDLGDGGFTNYASWQDSNGVSANDSVFIIYRLNARYPVVAMKVIAMPASSTLNYHAVDADTDLPNGTTKADEWNMLTTTKALAAYCDVISELGANNITLPDGGGAHLTYVIGLGTTEEEARAALRRGADVFNGVAAVNPMPAHSTNTSFQIWPDPAERELNISLPSVASGEILTLKFTDALGRNIFEGKIANGGQIDIEGIPSGIYLLEVEKGSDRFVRTFVKE